MRRHVLPAAVLLGVTGVFACVRPAAVQFADLRGPRGDCAAPALDIGARPADIEVRWIARADSTHRSELDEWCRGVGAPVVSSAAAHEPAHVDSVAVITWNVHLGAGRIADLVEDLRTGALTGGPVDHFVLLLQEARRGGSGVPAFDTGARAARRLGVGNARAERDIVVMSQRLGLHLFYVPSMRNGGRGHEAEDRGNAIISTLPIAELTAIELPLLAQRRVAIAATIPLRDLSGRPRELRVSSVHLDIGGKLTRPLALFGSGRTEQAGALASALAGAENTVVGGDFNTWSSHRLEGGLGIMQAGFPDFPAGSAEATFHTAGVWPRRLDHLFLRARDVAGSAPDRIDDRYGSDHFPVLAWVRIAS
jgi:endonuclease/exonuclease/phosphatase family metal-dependent hydrolase